MPSFQESAYSPCVADPDPVLCLYGFNDFVCGERNSQLAFPGQADFHPPGMRVARRHGFSGKLSQMGPAKEDSHGDGLGAFGDRAGGCQFSL